MNIDETLSKLADPTKSSKEKQKIMDNLREKTLQEKKAPIHNAIINLGIGGLAALIGGAAGRKIGQKVLETGAPGPVSRYLSAQGNFGLRGITNIPVVPRDTQTAARKLLNAQATGRKATEMLSNKDELGPLKFFKKGMQKKAELGRQADLDAYTLSGAGLGGLLGLLAPGLIGGFGSTPAAPQSSDALVALNKIASGTASNADIQRYKEYYKNVSKSGGILPTLGSIVGSAALAAPVIYFGGPAVGRLVSKANLPIASTKHGQRLLGELAFDAAAGSAAAGLGGSLGYNALNNVYKEPF